MCGAFAQRHLFTWYFLGMSVNMAFTWMVGVDSRLNTPPSNPVTCGEGCKGQYWALVESRALHLVSQAVARDLEHRVSSDRCSGLWVS